MGKRLVRKTSNKIVGGVCAGLADYVGVSLTGLRFLVAFAVMASGIFPGVFFYMLCVILIPKEETSAWQHDDQNFRTDDPQNHPQQRVYENSQTRQQQEKPNDNGQEQFGEPSQAAGGGRAIGFVFILLGAGILMRTYLPAIDSLYLLAGGLMIVGVTLLFRRRRP